MAHTGAYQHGPHQCSGLSWANFNFIMRPFTCTSSLQTWASLITKFLHREFESSSFMVVWSSEAIDNHVSSNLLEVVFFFFKNNNNNQGFTALKIKLILCYRIQLDHSIKLNTNSWLGGEVKIQLFLLVGFIDKLKLADWVCFSINMLNLHLPELHWSLLATKPFFIFSVITWFV